MNVQIGITMGLTDLWRARYSLTERATSTEAPLFGWTANAGAKEAGSVRYEVRCCIADYTTGSV